MPLHIPIDAGSSAVRDRGRRRETWACAIIGLLVGLLYIWAVFQPANSWTISSRNPEGYYGLETAGFRSGHLYAAITPHPALLALPDPYDPVANAPYRVHDMTLYKGHYYLYFGVTPVLLLFWPVAAITGRYLSEPFAVGLFCAASIWVGMGLLLAIRRRHFPEAPFVALLAGWLCLAFATPLNLLLIGAQFYQIPISCAIFLQALMLAAIYRSLHSERRALAWMATAGLMFGLSIGARPNYLAGCIVLLIPVLIYSRRNPSGPDKGLTRLKSATFWTFLPPALCGFGLLYFNWARFGAASEFGMHYQLAGERFTALNAVSLSHLFPHVAYYLFNPGTWASYFPFFSAETGQPYGLLRYLPWAWLAVPAFLIPKIGEPGEREGRLAIVSALALAALANLAFLSCFFGTTARYPGDFANAWLILAGVGALALCGRAAGARRSRLAVSVLFVAAAISVFFSLAVFVGWFPRQEIFLGVARAANWPAYSWQKSHGVQFGGLRLDLVLPKQPPENAEPIFETGRQSDQRDWLEVEYLPKNRARLSFFHAGTGLFPGKDFSIPVDRKIKVEARCGSLLPPFSHPVFSGWSRTEYDDAKRELKITVNGEDVLSASIECYDSSPANMTLGRLAWFTGGMQQTFSGSIDHVERVALAKPPTVIPLFTKAEPVELTCFFPAANQPGADPLLLTGNGNESDLLYCVYDGANNIKFSMDHFGAGGPYSESVHYDPLVSHTVTIWMGSMAGKSATGDQHAAAPDRLVVIFDGRVLLNIDQVYYPSSPESAIVGFNAYGATGARREFTGRLESVRQVGEGVLPERVRNGSYGTVEMSVDFPFGLAGTQEPLVVTGVAGAGDFVYVRYVDSSHVVIGFDHWGIGGIVGKPITVDYGQTHRLAISFQSLYPPGSIPHDSDLVRVLMDGNSVLEGKFACHPSTEDKIKIGINTIGGSTCGPRFSGRILSVERFAKPRE